MALPGHSPPPFAGPSSPNHLLTGHVDTQLPRIYGPHPRSMLPPSPQNYRFANPPPIPTPSPSIPMMSDNREAAPYKRPGSSMSISSMLGGEPERPMQEMYPNHNLRGHSQPGSVSAPSPNFTVMSPPQQPSKPGLGEYSYKPRSRTPDRIGVSFGAAGARQRSSSSGTPFSRPAHFVEPHHRSSSTIPTPRYSDQPANMGFNGFNTGTNGHEDRVRRTSLSGIVQRPSSQPQAGQHMAQPLDPFQQNAHINHFADRQVPPEPIAVDPYQRNGTGSTYDIKPPGTNSIGRTSGPQMSPTRAPSLPSSPEARRVNANGIQGRTLASILNGTSPSYPHETGAVTAQRMIRQDSSQSQGERTVFGKSRQYSPFANSLVSQPQTASGVPIDEQGRKSSDELSQHRAILGLAAESKRRPFSPMPQVMVGVQAQTPVPDAGVKTEHGRVFSGLAGGIGSTPTPVNGQTRKDDNGTPLSEDNLMKMSRSTPGLSKRSRKMHEDDTGMDTENTNGGKSSSGRANKKGKHQHSYKHDLEEMTGQIGQRRNTPLTGLTPNRNVSMASNISSGITNNAYQSRVSDLGPVFRPKKMFKVAGVFNSVAKAPRRHLGNFTYRPEIAPSDLRKPNAQKFDISIRPNLLPSFSAAEHLNCTYTVHIPRIWLQDRERGLICTERFLWGSGIYTDDSDPIAAAIHAGFLKASLGDIVDSKLLSKVVNEQNPKIDWPKDLNFPERPLEIESAKDLDITLVVLPLLERYEGSARFGIQSRSWPESLEKTQHDGVSFGILKIDFVSIGMEELKMGRTGASRKERMRLDLEARQRGLQIQKEKIARVHQKRLKQAKVQKHTNPINGPRVVLKSVPITFTNGPEQSLARQVISSTA